LKQAEEDQKILDSTSGWDINTATSSASIKDLAVENLYVTGATAMTSLSLSQSLSMGTDMVIQSVINDDQIITNSIDTLTAPLQIQSLAMAPVEIMSGMFRIDTNGDVSITGNLYIAGRIESQGLTLKENPDLQPNQEGSEPDKLLSLQDSMGQEVAGINASGSAQFNQISTDKLIVAGATTATASADINGEIQTNATAGHAVIKSGENEITIRDEKVNNQTLVYITPTSSTGNNVLFVKAKGDGFFKVGFHDSINTDVEFNWWIIDTEQ